MAHTYEDEQLALREFQEAREQENIHAGTIARLIVKYNTLPSEEIKANYLAAIARSESAWKHWQEIHYAGEEASYGGDIDRPELSTEELMDEIMGQKS